MKDNTTKYTLNSNTLNIVTESITGGSDEVVFNLFTDSGSWISVIRWRFRNWVYNIRHCTPYYTQKFPVTPPTSVKKTWRITVSPDDIEIECNTLKVLHFIFNDTVRHDNLCTKKVKGKIATEVMFRKEDTATKMFTSKQVGK